MDGFRFRDWLSPELRDRAGDMSAPVVRTGEPHVQEGDPLYAQRLIGDLTRQTSRIFEAYGVQPESLGGGDEMRTLIDPAPGGSELVETTVPDEPKSLVFVSSSTDTGLTKLVEWSEGGTELVITTDCADGSRRVDTERSGVVIAWADRSLKDSFPLPEKKAPKPGVARTLLARLLAKPRQP